MHYSGPGGMYVRCLICLRLDCDFHLIESLYMYSYATVLQAGRAGRGTNHVRYAFRFIFPDVTNGLGNHLTRLVQDHLQSLNHQQQQRYHDAFRLRDSSVLASIPQCRVALDAEDVSNFASLCRMKRCVRDVLLSQFDLHSIDKAIPTTASVQPAPEPPILFDLNSDQKKAFDSIYGGDAKKCCNVCNPDFERLFPVGFYPRHAVKPVAAPLLAPAQPAPMIIGQHGVNASAAAVVDLPSSSDVVPMQLLCGICAAIMITLYCIVLMSSPCRSLADNNSHDNWSEGDEFLPSQFLTVFFGWLYSSSVY